MELLGSVLLILMLLVGAIGLGFGATALLLSKERRLLGMVGGGAVAIGSAACALTALDAAFYAMATPQIRRGLVLKCRHTPSRRGTGVDVEAEAGHGNASTHRPEEWSVECSVAGEPVTAQAEPDIWLRSSPGSYVELEFRSGRLGLVHSCRVARVP